MDITAVAVAAGSAIASFATLKAKHDSLEKSFNQLREEFGKLDERYMSRELLEARFTKQEEIATRTHTLTANTRDLIFQLLVSSKIPLAPEMVSRLILDKEGS